MVARQLYINIKTLLQEAGVENAGFDADALIEHAAGKPRLLLDEVTPAQAAQAMDLANCS